MSVCEALREPEVSAARVLARPRKNGVDEVELAIGDVGEGNEKAGCEAVRFAERSEACDMVRPPIGTVKLLMFWFELRGFHSVLRLFGRGGSSSGISSGAGRGLPLTTDTNWCSVHVSSWSSRPFQKGARRRSIWTHVSQRR